MTNRLRSLSAYGWAELVSVLYRLNMFWCKRSMRGRPTSSSMGFEGVDGSLQLNDAVVAGEER